MADAPEQIASVVPDIPRVKRNVSKMIEMGAPEHDIDSYLAGEKITPDQLRAHASAKAPEVDVAADVAKSAGIGTVKGGIGMVASPADPIMGAVEAARSGLQNFGVSMPRGLDQPLPSASQTIQHGIEQFTGKFYKPQSMPGRFAETGAEFATGAAMGGGGAARTGARMLGSLIPAAVSQTAAEAVDPKYEQIAKLLGAGVGIGVQGVGRAVTAPITSNIRARMDPEGYARAQVARMIDESKAPVSDIASGVGTAAAEGQPMFTVADAMGRAGQRGLSTVARAPGEGRTEVVDFLEGRQAGQGRRVANTLAEGFDAPQTAAQTRSRIEAARDTAADTSYEAVRQGAGPVDLSSTIAKIDTVLGGGPKRPLSNIADDSIEGAMRTVRDRLTDGKMSISDFETIQRTRAELSDKIKVADRRGEGNKARLLGQVLREMDTAMEAASSGFKQANKEFRASSKAMESVDEGRTAAQRGRSEDVVQNFQGRPQDQQAAFRSGYVDPLIEQAQGAPVGVNKAQPFTSDAFNAESQAMAPGAPLMNRRLGRENTMFESRAQAMGNSKTAENLADERAAGLNPTLVGHALQAIAHPVSAARGALVAGSNLLSGNTPQVRAEIGRILMMRGETATPAHIRDALEDMRRIEIARQLNRHLGRGIPAAIAASQGGSQQNAP